MVFGTKFHSALLEPDNYRKQYSILPDGAPPRPTDRQRNAKKPSDATVAAVKWWDAWEADGRETISTTDANAIGGMVASVLGSQCKDYTHGGRSEVVLLWEDKPHGFYRKARLDYLQAEPYGSVITDVKTTEDASEGAFEYSVWKYGYYLSAAYYVDLYEAITGDRPFFSWLAVEKRPPYFSKVHQIGDKTLQGGRNLYRKLLDHWAECLKTGVYPGYGGPSTLELNTWRLEQLGVGRYNLETEPVPVIAEPEDDGLTFVERYDLGDDDE
jgi:hypothetical protein